MEVLNQLLQDMRDIVEINQHLIDMMSELINFVACSSKRPDLFSDILTRSEGVIMRKLLSHKVDTQVVLPDWVIFSQIGLQKINFDGGVNQLRVGCFWATRRRHVTAYSVS